jgi:hypothetical protein
MEGIPSPASAKWFLLTGNPGMGVRRGPGVDSANVLLKLGFPGRLRGGLISGFCSSLISTRCAQLPNLAWSCGGMGCAIGCAITGEATLTNGGGSGAVNVVSVGGARDDCQGFPRGCWRLLLAP